MMATAIPSSASEQENWYSSTLFWSILIILLILGGNFYYEFPDVMLVANREDGRATLLEVVAKQDDYFAQHQKYATTLEELGYTEVKDFSIESPKGLYRIWINEGDGSFYSLSAEPQNEQTGDNKCAPLTYASKGRAKSAKGSNGSACW
ncbi:type IV pilin protein [Candidatus Magnetaquicoccus inordinatus]|uniref:type IV pilin protein n=1 Tax=Candidatus Magnetaquicoccus inordinatus TaxID=2496818 RepID=UPI00102BE46C|nr:type IV pilin protein [Candidatus Magnetaquicoccus inordinatus]